MTFLNKLKSAHRGKIFARWYLAITITSHNYSGQIIGQGVESREIYNRPCHGFRPHLDE